MRFDKKTIEINFKNVLIRGANRQSQIKDRDDLLLRMGVGEKDIENVPVMINNSIENVINPYFVAKYHSEIGLPKEATLEEIEKLFNIKANDYWSDWCDFWFDSFIKIPHNILCDSKTYFEKMGY